MMKRAQRRIADHLLGDPEQFIDRPIAELASACGVSTGSIVHFSKSLGLRGLPGLRIALARELAEPVLPLTVARPRSGGGAVSVIQRVLEEHVESLRQTLRLNPASTVSRAIDALLRAERIVLFSIGLSYSVAYSLYARLRFIGLPAFIESDSHMQLAAAAEMRREELAIGISASGTTSETVECLRIARAQGARTLCITNSIDSPLATAADFRLYAAPGEVKYFQAPLASRVAQLALADVLLVGLGSKRKREALAHLRRAEVHLLKRRVSAKTAAARVVVRHEHPVE